jgi:hypothetical protein
LFSFALLDILARHDVAYSMTVRINAEIRAHIEAIDEWAWHSITYPDGGEAQVAETTLVTGKRGTGREIHLVVRRSRLNDPRQLAAVARLAPPRLRHRSRTRHRGRRRFPPCPCRHRTRHP